MKKIIIGLFIVFLILWTPYFIQTYNLKLLSESDLPAEGGWASLEEGNLYYRWYYPGNTSDSKDCPLLKKPNHLQPEDLTQRAI